MLPKKIQQKLTELNIKNVVSGYFTRFENLTAAGQSAYTCWDKNGIPICVLYKEPNADWSLTPYLKSHK